MAHSKPVIDMANIAYFEIPADDMERAKKFYKTVFGWDIRRIPMEGVPPDYQSVMTGDAVTIKGPNYEMSQLNSGGMMKRAFPEQKITNYVQVESLEDALNIVKENGGKQFRDTVNIPNVGRITIIEDTEGNLLGLWQPVKPEQG